MILFCTWKTQRELLLSAKTEKVSAKIDFFYIFLFEISFFFLTQNDNEEKYIIFACNKTKDVSYGK